jgi:uncharacterized protein (DUF1697 family)
VARTYVVLIPGINVGRARRVAMVDLRSLLEALGYRDVRTFLNSGNVVVTEDRRGHAAVASEIEGAMQRRLGVSTRVEPGSTGRCDRRRSRSLDDAGAR